MNPAPFGLMAEYASEKALRAALARVRAAGATRVEVFTPYPVDGLEDLLPGRPTPMARIMGAAAAVGAAGGYFLQWYAARDFPLDVGGRPLNSWPMFVPVTFELAVLTTAVVGVIGFLWLAGFPRLDHPAFADRRFVRASQDRFFLCVRADDPRFAEPAVRAALDGSSAESIAEVPA